MDFHLDLGEHQIARDRKFLLATEDVVDPSAVARLADAMAAERLLYANLDREQAAVYADLKACGVLP